MSIKISISSAMHDGLGFAAKRFSEVLRIAWFPYLLLFGVMLWIALGVAPNLNWMDPRTPLFLLAINAPAALLVNATVMVALIGMAVRGVPPHHRSIHFSFGPREILFILASIFSVLFVGVLSLGPGIYLQVLIDTFASEQEAQTAFFFTEGSLHEGAENLLYPDGHPVRSWQPWALFGTYAFLGYLALRLFMLPILVAAGSATPLRSALRASAGLNVLRLLLLFVVFVIVQVVADFSARIVATLAMSVGGLFGMVVNVARNWGLDFATPGWAEQAQIVVAFGVAALFTITIQSFTAGLIAGFAGGVARQVEGSDA